MGNYNQANQVFVNDGSGGFSEDSSSAIAVGTDNTISVALGDLDGDGGAISSRPRVALAAARA